MGHLTMNEFSDKLIRSLTSTAYCVDTETKDCISDGMLVLDPTASNGYSYTITSSDTAQMLYRGDFKDMKFGNYSICMRMKVSDNSSSSNILTVNLNSGSSVILSKQISGTMFDSTSDYCYLCTSFEYKSNGNNKAPISFSLETNTVSGIDVYFDYAYISLITPAIYL